MRRGGGGGGCNKTATGIIVLMFVGRRPRQTLLIVSTMIRQCLLYPLSSLTSFRNPVCLYISLFIF